MKQARSYALEETTAVVSGGSEVDELLFQATGSEEVNNDPRIYESRVEALTYRW